MPSCCLPSAFEWKSLKPILEKTTGEKFSGRKSQGLSNRKKIYPTVIIIIIIVIALVINPTDSKVFQIFFYILGNWTTGKTFWPNTVYFDLKYEIKRICSCRSVKVIPIVIGVLGTVSRGFGGWLKQLGMPHCMERLSRRPYWCAG